MKSLFIAIAIGIQVGTIFEFTFSVSKYVYQICYGKSKHLSVKMITTIFLSICNYDTRLRLFVDGIKDSFRNLPPGTYFLNTHEGITNILDDLEKEGVLRYVRLKELRTKKNILAGITTLNKKEMVTTRHTTKLS